MTEYRYIKKRDVVVVDDWTFNQLIIARGRSKNTFQGFDVEGRKMGALPFQKTNGKIVAIIGWSLYKYEASKH